MINFSGQMQDMHRKENFNAKRNRRDVLSASESWRILRTAELVPQNWQSLLDVGGGDGRIACELMRRGHRIIGLDWSSSSLAFFPGDKVVCDLRKPWPLRFKAEGAICCEVIEHLTFKEAKAVIEHLFVFTSMGFVITVPANEPLDVYKVLCQSCKESYHIWGHLQAFETFEQIDNLVGKTAARHEFITSISGIRFSKTLSRWQKRLGFEPFDSSCLCPYCGSKLLPWHNPGLLPSLGNKFIAGMQRIGSPFRKPQGWYACLYEHSSC